MVHRNRFCHPGHFTERIMNDIITLQRNSNSVYFIPNQFCRMNTEFGGQHTVKGTGCSRMIERGINVLTISAYQFVQSARESYFDQENNMDELMNIPVLMLDDLGSEPLIRNITIEVLFNLINERLIRGRSTVISTNLKLEELRERYTERIVSRISDPATSLVITLEGKEKALFSEC